MAETEIGDAGLVVGVGTDNRFKLHSIEEVEGGSVD